MTPPRLYLRTALALLGLGLLSTAGTAQAQSVRAQSTQLELGVHGALPIAGGGYDGALRYGGGVAARWALSRGRFTFDAGFEGAALRVDHGWYQGDATWIRHALTFRVRALVGARYAFISGEHAQLYGRLGVGLESRIARYDIHYDTPPVDAPNSPLRRDTTWAPVLDPGIGLRLGGAHHFALLQASFPIAFHRKDVIHVFGSGGNNLAVDVSVSVFVGWTL